MANKQDPLVESLIGLAVSAAPLIRRAREAGLFKTGSQEEAAAETVVEATVVKPAAAEPQPDLAAEKAALQEIIVNQAMKIAALEAELANLKAAAGKGKRASKA